MALGPYGRISEARVWNTTMSVAAEKIFKAAKLFIEKKQRIIDGALYSVKGGFEESYGMDLKSGDQVLLTVEYESIPDAIYGYGFEAYSDEVELADGIYDMKIKLWFNAVAFPEAYSDLYAELRDVIRHEVEHVDQWAGRRSETFTEYGDNFWEYLLAKHEAPAFLAGFLQQAKIKKVSMNEIIRNYLNDFSNKTLPPRHRKNVYKEWIKTGMKMYPNAVWETNEQQVNEYGPAGDLLVVSRQMVDWVKDFSKSWNPLGKVYELERDFTIGRDKVPMKYILQINDSSEYAWSIKGMMGEDSEGDNAILISLEMNTALYPETMSEIVTQIKGVLAHEAEHVSQWFGKRGEEMLPPAKRWEEYHSRGAEDYLTDKREVQAYVTQSLRVAKTNKITMREAMLQELERVFDKDEKALNRVLDKWVTAGKKKYPHADWSDA